MIIKKSRLIIKLYKIKIDILKDKRYYNKLIENWEECYFFIYNV